MVTNFSKEQPGSIVTKTLKNGILMSIATSNESHFNVDFKYMFHQDQLYLSKVTSLRKFTSFQKIGGTPLKSHTILTKITPPDSAYQRTSLWKFQAPIYKNVQFRIFCQKTDHGCVFICLFFCLFFFVCLFVFCFFPRGDRMD